MKIPILLALLLLTPPVGASGGARLASARASAVRPAPETVSCVWKYSAAATPRPGSLGERLRAVRLRYQGQRSRTELSLAREQRRLAELRPLPADTLGALQRRTLLGERTRAARDDRRLGSQARRELLTRPPTARGPRPRR